MAAVRVEFLRCKIGFIHHRKVVKGGQVVRATDPIVKGREHLFEPLESTVEMAVADPGIKRVLPPGSKFRKEKG